jgi:hypothetical protein
VEGTLVPCPSYPGWFATSDGRLWSARKRRWVRPYRNNGYLAVKYQWPDGQQTVYVHQAVADAFLGPCPDGCEVNHQDLDKSNNHATNLEYLTRRGNQQRARRHQSWRHATRQRWTITAADIPRVRLFLSAGCKTADIAWHFGVTPESIRNVARGLTWAFIP